MPTQTVDVRALFGWRATVAIAREGSCVADLRLRISELKPEYARAKLFYKGRALQDSEVLSTLSIGASDFVTVCPVGGGKGRSTGHGGAAANPAGAPASGPAPQPGARAGSTGGTAGPAAAARPGPAAGVAPPTPAAAPAAAGQGWAAVPSGGGRGAARLEPTHAAAAHTAAAAAPPPTTREAGPTTAPTAAAAAAPTSRPRLGGAHAARGRGRIAGAAAAAAPGEDPSPADMLPPAAPYGSDGLITLLPGYESRPNRTPTKRRPPPPPPAGQLPGLLSAPTLPPLGVTQGGGETMPSRGLPAGLEGVLSQSWAGAPGAAAGAAEAAGACGGCLQAGALPGQYGPPHRRRVLAFEGPEQPVSAALVGGAPGVQQWEQQPEQQGEQRPGQGRGQEKGKQSGQRRQALLSTQPGEHVAGATESMGVPGTAGEGITQDRAGDIGGGPAGGNGVTARGGSGGQGGGDGGDAVLSELLAELQGAPLQRDGEPGQGASLQLDGEQFHTREGQAPVQLPPKQREPAGRGAEMGGLGDNVHDAGVPGTGGTSRQQGRQQRGQEPELSPGQRQQQQWEENGTSRRYSLRSRRAVSWSSDEGNGGGWGQGQDVGLTATGLSLGQEGSGSESATDGSSWHSEGEEEEENGRGAKEDEEAGGVGRARKRRCYGQQPSAAPGRQGQGQRRPGQGRARRGAPLVAAGESNGGSTLAVDGRGRAAGGRGRRQPAAGSAGVGGAAEGAAAAPILGEAGAVVLGAQPDGIHGSVKGVSDEPGDRLGQHGPQNNGRPAPVPAAAAAAGGRKRRKRGKSPSAAAAAAAVPLAEPSPTPAPNEPTNPHAGDTLQSQAPGDQESGGEAGQGGDGGPSGGIGGGGGGGGGRRRGRGQFAREGPAFERAVAACVLPLPPLMRRLEELYGALNALYGFAVQQRMQLTWSHCAAHLQFALPGKVVGPDDLRLAARLAPDALLLRPIKRKSDTGAAADPGSKPGATHVGAGNPVGTEGGVAAGAGAGVVGGAGGPAGGGVQEGRHGGHGGGGWDVGGVDRAQQLDSLVAGAVGAGPGAVGPAAPAATSAADGDEEDFAIELLDPGRCGPLLFEVEANGDSASPGSAETGRARQEGDRGADEAAVGDEEEANADVKRDAKRTRKQRRGPLHTPVVLPDGRRLHFCANVHTRRLGAFRRCLVAVVDRLHTDFVEQLGQPGRGPAGAAATGAAAATRNATAAGTAATTTAAATAVAADGADAPSRVGDLPAPSATAAARTPSPLPDGGGHSGDDEPWDPVVRRAWHPALAPLLATLSRHQLLAAAAELRARRVLLAKMAAAAARRGGGGDGSDGDGWGGWSSGRTPGAALRPPSLLRGHDPCTSCRVLDPVQLLDHLQMLSWYQGQVLHEEVLPARPPAYATPRAPLAPPVLRALASLGIATWEGKGEEEAAGGRDHTHTGVGAHGGQTAATTDRCFAPCGGARETAAAFATGGGVSNGVGGHGQLEGQAVAARIEEGGDGTQRGDGGGNDGGGWRVRLYRHQAAAIDALLGYGLGAEGGDGATEDVKVPAGGHGVHGVRRHVVVATSTASGKSLCYVVPLIQALSEDPDACALLMFPTKALAQDQMRALQGLLRAAFGPAGPTVAVYDGDTPMCDRADIRATAQVVITNPDMLHCSVLPAHRSFGRLLAKLRLLVVDEAHAYRGVFGCHTAMVIRRLRRLCHHVYGSDPACVLTSATVANPQQHAAVLLGVPEEQVLCVGPEQDGSPHGVQRFVLWNPPLTEKARKAQLDLEKSRAAARAAAARGSVAAAEGAEGGGQGVAGGRRGGVLGAAALPAGLMTRTEVRASGRVSRNAQRAMLRRELAEAKSLRARGTQVAAAGLLGVMAAQAAATAEQQAGSGGGGGDGGGGSGTPLAAGRSGKDRPGGVDDGQGVGPGDGEGGGGGGMSPVVAAEFRRALAAGRHVAALKAALFGGGVDRRRAAEREQRALEMVLEDRQQRQQAQQQEALQQQRSPRSGALGRGCMGQDAAAPGAVREAACAGTLKREQPATVAEAAASEPLATGARGPVGTASSAGRASAHTAAVAVKAEPLCDQEKGSAPGPATGAAPAPLVAPGPDPPATDVAPRAAAAAPANKNSTHGGALRKRKAPAGAPQLDSQETVGKGSGNGDGSGTGSAGGDRVKELRRQQKRSRDAAALVAHARAALSAVTCSGTRLGGAATGRGAAPPQCGASAAIDPANGGHLADETGSGQEQQQRRTRPVYVRLGGAAVALGLIGSGGDGGSRGGGGGAPEDPIAAVVAAAMAASNPDTGGGGAAADAAWQLRLREQEEALRERMQRMPGGAQAGAGDGGEPGVPVDGAGEDGNAAGGSSGGGGGDVVDGGGGGGGDGGGGGGGGFRWREQHGAAGTPLEARRESPIVEMSLLLAECVQHGLRTIAFCKSRKVCELVTAYTREVLAACAPEHVHRVKVYRAGYSPADRRAMEADLHSGALCALAATNALELGVDVGGLDVTLHLGFPGSIASLRQQAGRAGRREQPCLSLLVAFDGPLDQHFMRHPEQLFGRPIERVQVDVHNRDVVTQHVLCAALEHPLLLDPLHDLPFFGAHTLPAVAQRLLARDLLARRPGAVLPPPQQQLPAPQAPHPPQHPAPHPATPGSGHHTHASLGLGTAAHVAFMQPGAGGADALPVGSAGPAPVPLVYSGARDNPASLICLRSIDPDRFVIWDEASGRPLEEVEANMAFYEVYDGAVYMFQGRPYLCRKLNLGERVALVRPADVKYYTKTRDYTDVHVTGCHVAYSADSTARLFPKLEAPPEQPTPHPQPHHQPPAAGAPAPAPAPDMPQQHPAPPAPPPSSTHATADHASTSTHSCCLHGLGGAPCSGPTCSSPTPCSAPPGHGHGNPCSSARCESAVVVVRFLGFHRVWQGSGQVFDSVDLFLPDIVYDTQATYVRVPPSAREECLRRGLAFREGVHGANHAVLNVVPLYLTANPNDLGTECDNPYDARYRIDRLLMYDKHRGGMGLAAAAVHLYPLLLRQAYARVAECDCPYAKGCPSCVQHLDCRNYNAVLCKAGAEVVLRHVLRQEREGARARGQPWPEGW